MNTLDKLVLACKEVERWEKRHAQAIRQLIRAEAKLPGLRRKQGRLEAKFEAEEQQAKRPEPEPVLVEVIKVIEEAKKDLPSPIDMGYLGPLPESVPDDLDIPDALRRDKAVAEQLRTEIAEAKRNKATARALKVKGQVAERKAHAEIPKSKRRWDTNHSKWVEA